MMKSEMETNPCAGCSGRRDFLRDAATMAAGVLVALGADHRSAWGMSARTIAPLLSGPSEATYPIPAADGASIDRDHEVILVRWQGQAYAFALSCPHKRQMLRWQEDNARFQCPKHHSKYSPDGNFLSGRATRGMDRYPVRTEGGRLVVTLGDKIQQDKNEAAWKAAAARL